MNSRGYPTSRRSLLAAALLLASAVPLAAHGPTPQKADETIIIAAPPDKVWALVSAFGRIGDWHPMVKKVEATGGDEAGAERTLVLEGGRVTEGLDESDAAGRRLSWRLLAENVEAIPVSFYTATIEVTPSGEGSQVAWSARFYRGDTGNYPPEELNDDAAIAAMAAFVTQGLGGLKAKLETP
ncbi:SRPBCC family protein [Ancylobacter pratisalsi]|uniref:SRPBCC family protein n=1 Tax=Ancylobacter pratisalsi TaxID=1745854 RepID=A0A6P1YQM0_9HYPH|nr:SRPBCC family protein [Ancylobacter pratisalsi]QIB35767.1 SRPBCC family protein [Ancylobacter pratisalsi]